MARLDEVQALFFRAIRWPSGVKDFLEQADPHTRAQFGSFFDESNAFGRVERLEIYANAYFHRLLGALVEMLPRLVFFVGEVEFHNLITDYVLACPSTCGDLRRYADRLPGYLQQHAVGRHDPHLAQIARVELALSDALDAADAAPVTVAELGALPVEQWPAMRFAFSPAVRVVSTNWRWELVEQAWRSGSRVALASEPDLQAVLVSRRRHAVSARTLSAAEAAALRAIEAGLTFGQACERVAEDFPECDPNVLVGFVQQWLEHEVLVKASLAANEA